MTNPLRLLLLLLMGGALLAARWANGRNQPQPQATRMPAPGPYRLLEVRQPVRLPGRGPLQPLAPSARFAELRSW